LAKHTLPEDEVIFVRSFRHWRTGKRVYPKKGPVIAIRIRKKPETIAQ